EAEDEAVQAVSAVDLHDVPEDRLRADLDHRLRPVLGLLAQPRALAAAEDDHRHVGFRGPAHGRSFARIPGRFYLHSDVAQGAELLDLQLVHLAAAAGARQPGRESQALVGGYRAQGMEPDEAGVERL